MWVRSQDKTILMDVKEFKLESGKNNFIVGFNGCFKDLGIYSTKEKALKVLDMIQKFIGTNDVFQMPQDSEV